MHSTESVEVDRDEQRPVMAVRHRLIGPHSHRLLWAELGTVSEPMHTTHNRMRTSTYPISVRSIHLA
jgi:hypothetical protein